MCGIAGFTGFSDNSVRGETANKIQLHRGPDSQGLWSDDHITLAHQRLSIIDLNPRSDQPMVKDEYVIIFNGEIYNYKELQKELIEKYNVNFKTQSDTEVVLESFRIFGETCVNKFLGMFAFAIYNLTNSSIYLARDHFGIKPLFYTLDKSTFSFASELKTLASFQDFDKTINYSSLIASLNYLWIPGNETIFKSTKKLPPGYYLCIDKQLNSRLIKYAQVKDSVNLVEETETIVSLDSVFQSSIERHMLADVPVSCFLSGGLDSSLISVLAKQYNSTLSTYTIATNPEDQIVEQMPLDELYARKVAEKNKFDHHEIVINADIVKLLPKIVTMLDEPIGDPATINTFLICDEARKKNVKVLLSGMGADELFFGYRRQKATLMAMRYRKYIPSLLRKMIQYITNRLPVKFMGRGFRYIRWAKKFLSFVELPISHSYMQSYSYYNNNELNKLMKDDYKDEIKQLYQNHDKIFHEKYSGDAINQMCNTDLQMFMVGLNLTYTDRASMAASVEVRVPFIDRMVVETAMRISGDLKYKNRESKYILKKMAEKYLSKEIIYRPKASFGAPIRSWMSGALKDMVDEYLSLEQLTKRGIFNADYVRKLINDDRRGLRDNAYRIYQLLTIEIWFQKYVD